MHLRDLLLFLEAIHFQYWYITTIVLAFSSRQQVLKFLREIVATFFQFLSIKYCYWHYSISSNQIYFYCKILKVVFFSVVVKFILENSQICPAADI